MKVRRINMDAKQVILVNDWLEMPVGKIAAQVSHASMAFLTHNVREYIDKLVEEDEAYIEAGNFDGLSCYQNTLDLPVLSFDWIYGSFTKVILIVRSEEEWLRVKSKLDKNEVEYFEIIDKGLTVFDGVPTHTCTGFYPMEQEDINKYFGHLPLLR